MDKIVIVYPHIGEYGGIERNILALAEEITRRGFEPVLLCFYDNVNMQSLCKKLTVVILQDHWNPFLKASRVRKWIMQNQKSGKTMPLFFGGKAGFYAGMARLNFFALHYTDPPSLLGAKDAGPGSGLSQLRRSLSDWFTNQGVKRAKVRLTMIRRNAEELESLYGKAFDVVLQGGLGAPRTVNDSQRCQREVLRIFSICRIASSKNLDWILSTAKYLRSSPVFVRDFKKMEVVIAGTGPHLHQLMSKSAEFGIEDCVQFPGFLDSAEVEEAYSQSDLFLVPARQGYGLPVLEALYRHVPVVLNVESRISEILHSNPWAAVSEDTVDSFQKTVLDHISRLRQHYPDPSALASLPSERQWADEIGKRCQWW